MREPIPYIAAAITGRSHFISVSVAYSSSESPLMPSLTPLQQLRLLGKLSPQFPDQLTGLLREQGYGDDVTSLKDADLSWLIEYLDDVRPRLLSPTRCRSWLRFSIPSTPTVPHFGKLYVNSGRYAATRKYYRSLTCFQLLS